MEGFDAAVRRAAAPTVSSDRLAERWLAFLFVLMLGFVALVALCAELLASHA